MSTNTCHSCCLFSVWFDCLIVAIAITVVVAINVVVAVAVVAVVNVC